LSPVTVWPAGPAVLLLLSDASVLPLSMRSCCANLLLSPPADWRDAPPLSPPPPPGVPPPPPPPAFLTTHALFVFCDSSRRWNAILRRPPSVFFVADLMRRLYFASTLLALCNRLAARPYPSSSALPGGKQLPTPTSRRSRPPRARHCIAQHCRLYPLCQPLRACGRPVQTV
jgi:hypothetical protein